MQFYSNRWSENILSADIDQLNDIIVWALMMVLVCDRCRYFSRVDGVNVAI